VSSWSPNRIFSGGLHKLYTYFVLTLPFFLTVVVTYKMTAKCCYLAISKYASVC